MLPSACDSEQAAAVVLGFSQVTWDNLSGEEEQPWSSSKAWYELSTNQKAAALLLGYRQTTWDNESGSEPQPASAAKSWAELTTCVESKSKTSMPHPYIVLCALLLFLLFISMQ